MRFINKFECLAIYEQDNQWLAIDVHEIRMLDCMRMSRIAVLAWFTWRQQKQQQESQRKGLWNDMTSSLFMSNILMSNDRMGPQQILVQQSESSAAKYTGCPLLLTMVYLLAVSKPVNAEPRSYNRTCQQIINKRFHSITNNYFE